MHPSLLAVGTYIYSERHKLTAVAREETMRYNSLMAWDGIESGPFMSAREEDRKGTRHWECPSVDSSSNQSLIHGSFSTSCFLGGCLLTKLGSSGPRKRKSYILLFITALSFLNNSRALPIKHRWASRWLQSSSKKYNGLFLWYSIHWFGDANMHSLSQECIGASVSLFHRSCLQMCTS